MPHIKTIDYPESDGRLREIYDDLIQKRGQLAEVHKIQSLRPESIVRHMDLYMEVMYSRSELSRAQREMLAVVVSVCNECLYCTIHHREALMHFWKDEERVRRFCSDFKDAGLSVVDRALCEYAAMLTNETGHASEEKHISDLKKIGLSDNAILDVVLVVAYFNFVNRIVMGLGVSLESDGAKGYKFE